MQPFLLVGVGGSGGKTLRAVRQSLRLQLRQIGWTEGIPDAFQFLHIDSVRQQDGADFPAPFLPTTSYLSLVQSGLAYENIYNTLKGKIDDTFRADVERPLPAPSEVSVDVSVGAGAFRGIGRTLAAASMGQIHSKVREALNAMGSAKAKADLAALAALVGDGGPGKPNIIVISSIAGGSGAGMFIDVAEAVKSAVGGVDSDHVKAILYAPDVFSQLGGLKNMTPNALGAISETMSGLWNPTPSPSTNALYKSQGVLLNPSEQYRIGPRYVFLVGRKNSANIDFHSQSAVYKAVGTSLTAWMTSPKIQDSFESYVVANWDSRAKAFPDNSPLKVPNADGTPFAALGFSRIALGLERFFEYASERLAKQAIVTMLSRHLEQDPQLKEKTSEQWVQHFADINEGRFLSDSGLNEVSESNNQVIDSLRPATSIQELTGSFAAQLRGFAEAGSQPAGQSFDQWVTKISGAYETYVQESLNKIAVGRQQVIKSWVGSVPEKLAKLVLSGVADLGLPVTSELVRRLNVSVKRAAVELQDERARHLNDVQNITLLVSSALGGVANMNTIAKNHPAVESAYQICGNALGWRAEADLKKDASELLIDLSNNLITPYEKKLAAVESAMQIAVNAAKLPDLRDNPFASWPSFNKDTVDKKFEPAPNEALLINPSDYPQIMAELIERTVNDPGQAADRFVVREFLQGAWGSDVVSNLPKQDQWSLLEYRQRWVPANSSFQVSGAGNGQPAVIDFVTDHMEYLEMAGKWLNIPGRAFKAYINQSLSEFLDQRTDPTNAPARIQAFQREFSKFVSAADPLVEVNKTLLAVVHNATDIKRITVCSPIPIDESSPLYSSCQAVLNQNGMWDASSPDWFVGEGAGAGLNSIDIFTTLSAPFQPMVMSSVTEPIASNWAAAQTTKSEREAFVKQRRGRTLAEVIPASPSQWQAMLRGWFVARLLSQVEEHQDASFKEKGPRLSIWCDPADGMMDFPYPLYASRIDGTDDYPAVLLQSLAVAMINCHDAGTLRPLAPYSRLAELGEHGLSELSQWLGNGVLPTGAPVPHEQRAGSSTMDSVSRKAACVAFFDAEIKVFSEYMATFDSKVEKNPRVFPLVWEIRNEVKQALQSLRDDIQSFTPQRGL